MCDIGNIVSVTWNKKQEVGKGKGSGDERMIHLGSVFGLLQHMK